MCALPMPETHRPIKDRDYTANRISRNSLSSAVELPCEACCHSFAKQSHHPCLNMRSQPVIFQVQPRKDQRCLRWIFGFGETAADSLLVWQIDEVFRMLDTPRRDVRACPAQSGAFSRLHPRDQKSRASSPTLLTRCDRFTWQSIPLAETCASTYTPHRCGEISQVAAPILYTPHPTNRRCRGRQVDQPKRAPSGCASAQIPS